MNESKTVLVIDDELGIREWLQSELSENGFRVHTAESGPHAMKILETNPVDIVVTDMKMPKMDGLDTLKAIRNSFRNMPIVLMTGYAMGGRVRKALESKASACLRKPFEIGDLTSAIQATLSA